MVIVTLFRDDPLLSASAEFRLLDSVDRNMNAGFLGEVRGVSLPSM